MDKAIQSEFDQLVFLQTELEKYSVHIDEILDHHVQDIVWRRLALERKQDALMRQQHLGHGSQQHLEYGTEQQLGYGREQQLGREQQMGLGRHVSSPQKLAALLTRSSGSRGSRRMSLVRTASF